MWCRESAMNRPTFDSSAVARSLRLASPAPRPRRAPGTVQLQCQPGDLQRVLDRRRTTPSGGTPRCRRSDRWCKVLPPRNVEQDSFAQRTPRWSPRSHRSRGTRSSTTAPPTRMSARVADPLQLATPSGWPPRRATRISSLSSSTVIVDAFIFSGLGVVRRACTIFANASAVPRRGDRHLVVELHDLVDHRREAVAHVGAARCSASPSTTPPEEPVRHAQRPGVLDRTCVPTAPLKPNSTSVDPPPTSIRASRLSNTGNAWSTPSWDSRASSCSR